MPYTLSLFSLKQNVLISFPDFDSFAGFAVTLDHSLDKKQGLATITPFQQNTPALRGRMDDFLKMIGQEHPNLKGMINYLKSVQPYHYFRVVFGAVNDTKQIMEYTRQLRLFQIEKGIDIPQVEYSQYWERLLDHYNFQLFGHQRKVIKGITRPAKRCRFCGTFEHQPNRRNQVVTFKNKSHAISEALGNKAVEIKDECDSCNQFFSEKVEPSLISYLSFFRALHGLEGKHGKKKLKGERFIFDPLGSMDIKLDQSFENPSAVKQIKTELFMKETFIPQDVYRCMVKFVLSVIPVEQVGQFQKTIDWVNKEFDAKRLPIVSRLQHVDFFTKKATLIYFEKKIVDPRLPELVGELHYADLVFTFIIPFAKSDRKQFLNAPSSKYFWEIFHNARPSYTWSNTVFNSSRVTKMALKIDIQGIEVGTNTFLKLPEKQASDPS